MQRKRDASESSQNLYGDNILMKGLGPIRSRKEVAKLLTHFPPRPVDVGTISPELAVHELMRVRDLHLPGLSGLDLYETIQLIVRQNYLHLDPIHPKTWSIVGGECRVKSDVVAEFACAVVGLSGTGKTQAVQRCLRLFPSQLIIHESFPRLIGPHTQVTWMSVTVPPGGRSIDVAGALREEWNLVTGTQRFSPFVANDRRTGMRLLEEWRQVAASHFLGLLHLDEVQNLFRISALKKRNMRSGLENAYELSIVEDQVLKWILTLMNTWHIPLLVSGTPDGINALCRRLSNAQRFASSGYHEFVRFSLDDVPLFRSVFFDQLAKYQYVAQPIKVDDDLAKLVLELTAGIHRLIIALWIGAQRIALRRGSGDLRTSDFKRAADTFLAPVREAVQALNSGDPRRMSMYEDLLPGNPSIWSGGGI
ncbi:AAA family ATPase [Polaromonas sp. YR568]|uniref:AAA family ATPase n=1 Tax=Polaromonas sp. YR568 TaxID=1855301 RepID=UPI003137A6DD